MKHQKLLENKLKEKINSISSLPGGDINEVYKIKTAKNNYVLKINRRNLFPKMFEKEKKGLEMLAKSGVKSPNIILSFSDQKYQYLVLEFIEEKEIISVFWENFAIDLVKIHQATAENFGFIHNNYIGSLHQDNSEKDTWETFFIENRIKPLVKQAFDLNKLDSNHLSCFENLYSRLNKILPKEKPALLHGDLWIGNLMCGRGQIPYFIDPAIYFGHREMDIAMTQLFGGFDNSYLNFYNEIFPLKDGWGKRIEIHNLYPRLVHLILFGRSYLSGIESVINKF